MNNWQIRDAVKLLNSGGIIAYPTESVFGLGCNPYNLKAVSRLLEIKQRPYTKGLILLVSDIKHALPLIQPLNREQLDQISQPSDRATTWLLNKDPHVSPLISGNHPKLAVRIATNPIAKQLCHSFGKPIISTSCNLSSKPMSTKTSEIRNKFLLKVDKILSGSCCQQSPSRIVDLETGKILRD